MRRDRGRGRRSGQNLAIYEVNLCAEIVENAGKFHTDEARPDNGQLLGQLREVKDLVADDGVFRALQLRYAGTRARRNQDGLCLYRFTPQSIQMPTLPVSP